MTYYLSVEESQPLPLHKLYYHSKQIFSLFIGRQPTTWPANNCIQIMVCSCAMPSNCVWMQIIFCTCVKETVLFSFLRSLLRENGRSLRFPMIFIKKTNRLSNDKTIIELGYRKISWFVSVSQINYLICSQQTNHDILLNLVQQLLIVQQNILSRTLLRVTNTRFRKQ